MMMPGCPRFCRSADKSRECRLPDMASRFLEVLLTRNLLHDLQEIERLNERKRQVEAFCVEDRVKRGRLATTGGTFSRSRLSTWLGRICP